MIAVERTIEEVRGALRTLQRDEGEWSFELEADATIPSEFILLEHFLGEIDAPLQSKLAAYLRATQGSHGGWPLYFDGDFNLSTSVKAYYALKLVGDAPEAPHMARARAAILERGGAAKANVFTRFNLALFGQVPWRALPVMPVEIMLLPDWAPFHLYKVAYWSRTVIVPMLILAALKPRAVNPRGATIEELFVVPPELERDYLVNPTGSPLGDMLLLVDRALRLCEPLFPRHARRRAIEKAVAFVTERLNGEDGLGGIYPAMANTVMAFTHLGYAPDHPDLLIAKRSVRKLVVEQEAAGYCQPCLSPVWDTALAMHALMEAGATRSDPSLTRAADWLIGRQITGVVGDWAVQRPGLRPGGWAFQYRNDYYPDLDDTAAVGMALHRLDQGADDPRIKESLGRAAEWIIGMQSRNGGWASFDADNTNGYLNHIPFADHGALLDPPTSDVTARCLGFLAQIGYETSHPVMERAIDFLKREQEPDGSWFGRWGTNYVYGTWSVLSALNGVGEDMAAPYVRKAVAWLESRQREDGGWGEDGASYWAERRDECKASTPSQTAWAVLALMAAGEVGGAAVRRGIAYLIAAPRSGAKWEEPWYTAVGFPRVFYLRYHGYSAYFPLWALSRYRNLTRGNSRRVPYSI